MSGGNTSGEEGESARSFGVATPAHLVQAPLLESLKSMKELSHDEIDELLGAYALEAIPPEEIRQVDAHLRTCAAHREQAARLGETVAGLASSVPERQPSAQLRDRILAAIRSEAASGVIGEPGRPAPPLVVPVKPVPRVPRLAWSPAMAALAAAILLAFLGGIGIDRLLTKPAQPAQIAWVFAGNAQAPGAVASLTYFRDRKQAVLATTGLPALPEGKLYEIWLFKNGTPVDAGTSGVAGGKLVLTITRDLTQYQQLAITAEPGEQSRPTATPILEGPLTAAAS
ncbi:MAG: anti-sigma factor [Candidatus Dormibacteraeota bacterium]|nr:anti-sigma factor [Candidatus Dormibacteraeota bacterium]